MNLRVQVECDILWLKCMKGKKNCEDILLTIFERGWGTNKWTLVCLPRLFNKNFVEKKLLSGNCRTFVASFSLVIFIYHAPSPLTSSSIAPLTNVEPFQVVKP